MLDPFCEHAKVGILLMMADPTTTMKREAFAQGFYESPLHGKFKKLQILTSEEPGIHNPSAGSMDSGLAAARRSGMTGKIGQTPFISFLTQ